MNDGALGGPPETQETTGPEEDGQRGLRAHVM